MYSNDEIMKQLNQKDDTYFGKSEKRVLWVLFKCLEENK